MQEISATGSARPSAMVKPMEKKPPSSAGSTPKPSKAAEREARLAEQLRRNLQRRKAKSRALKSASDDS